MPETVAKPMTDADGGWPKAELLDGQWNSPSVAKNELTQT